MDYQNGKIYQVTDIEHTKCYIGSTTQRLSKKICRLRICYKHWSKKDKKKKKVTLFNIFEEFGIDNCKIELIENYPCLYRYELVKREEYYIKNTDCVNKKTKDKTKKAKAKKIIETIEQQLSLIKKIQSKMSKEFNSLNI